MSGLCARVPACVSVHAFLAYLTLEITPFVWMWPGVGYELVHPSTHIRVHGNLCPYSVGQITWKRFSPLNNPYERMGE